ncbi:MAG: DUF4911 domain-containing protein [Desulfobulbaceae bacterium]|nr:DUF4911 domain-containing protein [Desulfobulbaceae bacterium]
MKSLIVLYALVEPSRIAFVKFIIEAYDGLAILSTIDSQSGRISLRCPEAAVEELTSLLCSLGVEIIN